MRDKMRINQGLKNILFALLILGVIGIFSMGSVSAEPTFSSMLPANNSKTADITPEFSGTVAGNLTGFITTLYINNTGAYESCGTTNCTNNTKCTIVSTCSLSSGTRAWYWNVTGSDALDTKSGVRNIVILTGLDSIPYIINDILPVFGGILGVVTAVFTIVIVVGIILFVLGVFGTVKDTTIEKIKKI